MRFGVIGAGTIGQLRAQTIRESAGAELLGVMDPIRENALKAAQGSSTTATDRLEQFLDLHLDAVVVSSPVHLHEEAVLGALERDCHVLCEKPLSNTVESCERMVEEARLRRRVFAVGFNHRYYPALKYVKSVLEAGTIGRLDHLRVFGGHDGLPNFRADWQYRAPQSGGGAMMDVGIHMTDITRHLVGEVAEVYGFQSNRVWGVDGSEDNAVAIFRTARGIPVAYQATWNEWRGYHFYVDAYGDKGMVRGYYAPMFNLLITQQEPGGPRRTKRLRYPEIIVREKLRSWTSTTLITFREELRDFLALVEGKRGLPLAMGHDGLRAIEIARAVRESSETGQPVVLATDPSPFT